MNRKVTVIGSGNVGASCAMKIAERELADVVLVDVLEGIPQGKALDMFESTPVRGRDVRMTGANEYGPTAHSEVVVVTAGFARKPGMSRDDLLWANYDVVKATVEQAVHFSPDCTLVMVTNPLDAMCHVAHRVSGFPKNRVVGMAGILDTARFRAFVAAEIGVSVADVSALVLGGHGDTMVPLTRYASVAGIPLTELMEKPVLEAIVQRTRNAGAEIVKLLKSGSAYYAPAEAVVEMVEAILKDKKRVFPCSALLEGEYGIRNLFVGVPVKMGAGGVEKIFEIALTDEEGAALQRSAAAVQELVDVMHARLEEIHPAAVGA